MYNFEVSVKTLLGNASGLEENVYSLPRHLCNFGCSAVPQLTHFFSLPFAFILVANIINKFVCLSTYIREVQETKM